MAAVTIMVSNTQEVHDTGEYIIGVGSKSLPEGFDLDLLEKCLREGIIRIIVKKE